jgi:PAS domain S-box-containing protein
MESVSITARHAQALIEGTADLVLVMGADGVYRGVRVDEPGYLIAPVDQLVGSNVHEMLPTEVADRIMACAERALGLGTVEPIEYDLVINDVLRAFEGRVVASGTDEFLLIVRELTERRRQESELRRLAEELEERVVELGRERDFTRALVRSIPSFLVLLDDDGCVLGLNESIEQVTGYCTDDANGRPFWEALMPEDGWSAAQSMFQALLTADEPGVRELELVTHAGDLLTVEWSGTPVSDQFGLRRVILCGVDVTERVRQEDELRRSRARIVDASDAERKRLERNLHDGAQQHLVVVAQALRLARKEMVDHPERAKELLDRAITSVSTAHADLRELARGLHPALLTERGLVAAIRALALRSSIPVELDLPEDCDGCLAPTIETAAYYVVAESLTNVAKYASATRVAVSVSRVDDRIVVEIADDGIGGADASRGTGLCGLDDRVSALDGTLTVESPPGVGTTVRAEFEAPPRSV